MFFFFFLSTTQFYIKNAYNDIFVCDRLPVVPGRLAKPCSRSHGIDFITNVDNNGFMTLKHQDTEHVLTVDPEDNLLKFSWHNPDLTEKFMFVMISPLNYIIKYKDGCLTYDKNDHKYFLDACAKTDAQMFQILTHYEYKKSKNYKRRYAIIKNEGFPIYGDSESTYASSCKVKRKCLFKKSRIRSTF